ncbi:MAG TPA: hypothetical protein VL728_19440 [Cyclobacteriaceae bacterium]|jgi:hypothetical protein|nr:hypothetical protein [Cyclobacteriaceae bacterium]
MDVQLRETGNGGDLVYMTRDLKTIYGFQNMAYLGMFGGNEEQSTPFKRLDTEQGFDWYGNSFFGSDPNTFFNSETERALNNTPLTSQGRQIIIDAVKSDLQFMKDFSTVQVAVEIVATNVVVIGVKILQPDSLLDKNYLFMWDALKKELDLSETVQNIQKRFGFDYTLNFQFEDI